MTLRIIIALILCFFVFAAPPLVSSGHTQETPAKDTIQPSADKILEQIEKRYGGRGFSARFKQVSTIQAIDITDTAQGVIYVKQPGKMRWEYESPQRQIIIANGNKLWVYRPEENQVMVGRAPDYFGEGKGIGFLSDMQTIRRNFSVLRVDDGSSNNYQLKLWPHSALPGVTDINISVSKTSFDLVRISTYNTYGDETIIDLHQFQFNPDLKDELFNFSIPPGTEVLQLQPQE